MERPRIFLETKETSSLTYQEVLATQISGDAKGLSFFVLSIDPDPKALYQIIISKLMNITALEITAIWTLELAHLTSGVYLGFAAGDSIVVRHKSTIEETAVKTAVSLAFNEVVG